MSPWVILGDVIGWALLAGIATIAMLIIYALIAAASRGAKNAKKTTVIMKSQQPKR
jgi:hypothetical protein